MKRCMEFISYIGMHFIQYFKFLTTCTPFSNFLVEIKIKTYQYSRYSNISTR